VITRLRALRGPNYWRLAPVIACDVRVGTLEELSSADVPGFAERVLRVVPSLEHREEPTEGQPPRASVREGVPFPEVLLQLALELQALAGSPAAYGQVVPSGDEGVSWVVMGYDEEQVALAAVREAEHIIHAALAGEQPDGERIVKHLQDVYEDTRLGPSTAAIVEEARRRGIPVRRLDSGSGVQLGLGRNLRRIQATLTDLTSAIGVEIAQDKDETKRMLASIGLPVPTGDVARSVEDAVEIADREGYPVLLKPLDANHGRGISGALESADAVREAYEIASRFGRRVVVERFIRGRDHRVLVVNGRVVACAERVPAHVTGDGRQTIAELIAEANRDPRRGVGHRKILTCLPTDGLTESFLAANGRTFDDVPAEGERVFLRATANLSTGGTSIDRTDELHPANATACEIAAGAIGLDVAGIDVLTSDIGVPLRANGAAIIEVNAAPGLRMHSHPTEGTARNVAAPIVDMLFPPGRPASIPIIAVTGSNGKTTTARLIAHLFRNTGRHVGFTTTDGVYVQNRLVMEGDMTGPFAANIILSNPSVDVAVLETARGGILRAGLGWDECDVGVVLNVSGDHLGLRGIHTLQQLAEAKAVIPKVVKREGHAVLNADDPLVYAMRDHTPGDVVLFSASEERSADLAEHIAAGGIGVVVEDGEFVVRRGRLRIPIADEGAVPLTLDGAARFQRENILAAIAAAYVLGIRYDDIRAGLLSFFPSPSLTPGRLNLLRHHSGGRVLVDYAHNPAAVAGLMDFAQRLPVTRRMAILAVPGDRRDEDIVAVGRVAGGALDRAIVKEDADLRGRAPGEVSRLLVQGLCDGGMRSEQVEVIADESQAMDRGLAQLGDGELLVILVDKVREALERLERHGDVAA
jgi:cyanophycin synthetase